MCHDSFICAMTHSLSRDFCCICHERPVRAISESKGEREKEGERQRNSARARVHALRARERKCVCVCVCVCEREIVKAAELLWHMTHSYVSFGMRGQFVR